MQRIIKLFTLVAILTLALFSGSILAATKSFVGVNYGPFHKDGQGPGTAIPDSQFLADLGTMASKFKYIKTYGVDTQSRLNHLVPLASQKYPNLKIYLGIYEDGNNHQGVTQPQLDLAILDARTHFRLWTFTEPVQVAFRKPTWVNNVGQAIANLLDDVRKVAMQPATRPAS